MVRLFSKAPTRRNAFSQRNAAVPRGLPQRRAGTSWQPLRLDKTIVFISHNFSGKLIGEYDDILVMQDGQLLTHGTFNELIVNCSYFRRICEIKFGNIL